MSELVEYLVKGKHPVEVTIRPERTLAAFRECYERGFVHIKFTDTRGGTELGVPIDRTLTNDAGADLNDGKGQLHIAGQLTLDYVPVRVLADIDLESLAGTGRLERVAAVSE